MKKILKNNVKLVIVMIVMIVGITTTLILTRPNLRKLLGSVNLMDLQAIDVPYTKNSQSTVQEAIDDLYTRSSKWLNPNDMGKPQYYATTGKYKGWCSSTDTSCNSYADFPTTSTTPPSGKKIYAGKYEDEQYGVCIQKNGKEHCFRGRNYKAEAKHVQEVFSDGRCNVNSSYVYCYASDFRCTVDSYGDAYCYDNGAYESCDVSTAGSVDCH